MQIFEMKASPKKREKVPGIQTSQIGIPFFLVDFFWWVFFGGQKNPKKLHFCNFLGFFGFPKKSREKNVAEFLVPTFDFVCGHFSTVQKNHQGMQAFEFWWLYLHATFEVVSCRLTYM